MKFNAIICIRVKVPFTHRARELDLDKHHVPSAPHPDGTKRYRIDDHAAYHKRLAEVETDRLAAGKKAEELAARIAKRLRLPLLEVTVEQVEEDGG